MNKTVQKTHELYDRFKTTSRSDWINDARTNEEFKLGKQWTEEEVKVLKSRGQAPIVVNRIYPAVETGKSLMTAKNPSFKVLPKEDGDVKTASAVNLLLEHIWNASDGNSELQSAIDNFYTVGVGYLLVYQDSMADNGRGEVKIKHVPYENVYVDPNSKSIMFDDAKSIIVSTMYTKAQAKKIEPLFNNAINNAASSYDFDHPSTDGSSYENDVRFPEDISSMTGGDEDDDFIRGYDRYDKILVKRIRVFEKYSGEEKVLDNAEFMDYIQRPVFIINNEAFEEEILAKEKIDELTKIYERQMQMFMQMANQAKQQVEGMKQQLEQLVQQGKMDEQQAIQRLQQVEQQVAQKLEQSKPKQPKVEQYLKKDLIMRKAIEVVSFNVWRIKRIVVMGDKLLYERMLPLENYPIVPLINIHTETPYPISDVSLTKALQKYINKTRSLIIAHAASTTNSKLIVPRGGANVAELEEKLALAGTAVVEVDFTEGVPFFLNQPPLPNELYVNEREAKKDIDNQFGLYGISMGDSSQAPPTYKATLVIDEFGQRRTKNKLFSVERVLKRVGQITIKLMQQLYTTEKFIRILQPNGLMVSATINKRIYDDYGNTIKILNDITIGTYDLIVIAGSTLPSSRVGQLEMYLELYKNGIIDRVEVLKKSEIFDIEGIMNRLDEKEKLANALKQVNAKLKQTQGDLQTREREVFHANQRAEIAEFKGRLKKEEANLGAAGTIYKSRMEDSSKKMEIEKSKQKELTEMLAKEIIDSRRNEKADKKKK